MPEDFLLFADIKHVTARSMRKQYGDSCNKYNINNNAFLHKLGACDDSPCLPSKFILSDTVKTCNVQTLSDNYVSEFHTAQHGNELPCSKHQRRQQQSLLSMTWSHGQVYLD